MKQPFGKVWDFETSDCWLYQRFRQVLKIFDILPLEEYVVDWDMCSCRFCCVSKQRIEIEYIFRRLIGLDKRYLLDLECYQDRARRLEEEKYAIY